MLKLFHEALYVCACVTSTLLPSIASYVLNHVRSVPPATASRASGSDSARAASGAFGFSTSSDLHPAAAITARRPRPRTVREICISDFLMVGSRGSVAELEHHGERAVARIGEVVHTVRKRVAATRARDVRIVAAVLRARPQFRADDAEPRRGEVRQAERPDERRWKLPVHGQLAKPDERPVLDEVLIRVEVVVERLVVTHRLPLGRRLARLVVDCIALLVERPLPGVGVDVPALHPVEQ